MKPTTDEIRKHWCTDLLKDEYWTKSRTETIDSLCDRVDELEGVLTRIHDQVRFQSHPALMEISQLCREALEESDETDVGGDDRCSASS